MVFKGLTILEDLGKELFKTAGSLRERAKIRTIVISRNVFEINFIDNFRNK